MKWLTKAKKIIGMSDFFNSNQMLRYENQDQYRTLTGGVISLCIIVTILIGFASMIIDTLNLSSISYTQNVEKKISPTSTTIIADPEKNFMFGLEIWHQNLSEPLRYFDVIATSCVEKAGVSISTILPLVECTKEHWLSLPDVVDNFQKLQMSGWLCPPIGASYQLLGKYTSDLYLEIIIHVNPCSNSSQYDRPCASPEAIDELFKDNGDWFYFTFYYINQVINPNQQTYKSYYLQDMAYTIFGKNFGVQSYLYFTDYSIKTDYSIWPFKNIQQDIGFLTESLPYSHPFFFSENSESYVNFGVAKSPRSIEYTRQVQKISTVFSFIGGLISALMAGLFIVNIYTAFSFEIDIAFAVFHKKNAPKEQEANRNNKNNVIEFIKYNWYCFMKAIGFEPSNNHMKFIHESRQQILRQLDVKSIIKRLIFLEYCISFIFTDFQLDELQSSKPTHPNKIRSLRRKIEDIDDFLNSQEQNSNQAKFRDMIEPCNSENLLILSNVLYSSKVANIAVAMKAKRKIPQQQIAEGARQDISEQDVIKGVARSKRMIRKEKRKAANQLIILESGNKGNEIGQRICKSISQIKDDV